MLRNKSAATLSIRYDAKNYTISGNAIFDIGELLRISPQQALSLEGFFISKHPNELERAPEGAKATAGAAVDTAAETTAGKQENPFGNEEGHAGSADVAKDPEAMKREELMGYLTENDVLEGWNGKTTKADLLKLAQEVRAKKGATAPVA